MDYKLFNDLVLGSFFLHPLLVVIIDTKQFQRLRHLKQLGVCSYVFPTASHTRFEHSIGTAHLAGRLFDSLKNKRIPTDVRNEEDWEIRKLCVEIGGLCHDLGHGPFSHTWEHFMERVGEDWHHENESVRIFEELLHEQVSPSKKFAEFDIKTVRDVFHLYNLRQNEIDLIKRIILGKRDEHNYMFQIINNKINGIDVDKWEYVSRDSHMLKIPTSFDLERLINSCRIIQDGNGHEQLCYREEACSQLIDLFISRGKLHDLAYQRKTVIIIQEMILDAFALANERLRLAETRVSKLSDHVYQVILHDNSDDVNMQRAKSVLERVERRHLYQCVAQEAFEGKCPDLNELKNLIGGIVGMDGYIENIGLTTVSIDMTKFNKKKPLRKVLIYKKSRLNNQYTCEPFDWSKCQHCLKPNLARMKRDQVLVLYKGLDDFPQDLTDVLVRTLPELLGGLC